MACDSSAEAFGIRADEGEASKEEKQQAEKICHEQGKRIRSNNSCVNNREDKIKVDKIMLTRFGKLKKHHSSRETKGSCFS